MERQTTEDNVDPEVEETAVERENHRVTVGRRRRAKTETKIIYAAVQVFGSLGSDAPVIDDFIRAAGIARGTFYNYFKSVDELLRATSDLLSEELVETIDREIRQVKDPVMRFGLGMRLWMRWAHANPSWCLFIARVWSSVKYERPLVDIREAIRKKLFSAPDAYVALDVISGAIRQAMLRIGEGNVRRNYGDAVVQMCLQALGARPETIAEILALSLSDLPQK